MKRRMNKSISLILAVLMLIVVFTGCATGKTVQSAIAGTAENGAEPLKICVDLSSFHAVYDFGMAGLMEGYDHRTAMRKFEADFKAYLQMNSLDPIDLTIEYIPEYVEGGNPERETVIARLRTEIMAGKGPDIFLLGSNDRGEIEPLFIIPEKNMANGTFLPLNDYIENAEFMEFEKLVPGVMSAGQYDGEQYILPMTYTMPLTIYNGSEVQDAASKTMTWGRMLEGEPYLRHAAYFYSGIGQMCRVYLLNSLGRIADYKSDKLLLTEEELLKRTEEMITLEHERFYSDDTGTELPANWQMYLCYGFDRLTKWRGYRPSPQKPFAEETDTSLLPLEDPFTIVPMYSDDGGAMATVLTYAAINANTKQPEKAFYVLDYLFGLKSQQSSAVFHLTCTDAIPVHMDLMQEDYPLLYRGDPSYLGTYCLEEGTYRELREVQEQITGAAFCNVIFNELESMYHKCSFAKRKGESYEGYVAETYDLLRQIMAE